jgi:hypothetical protein
MEEGCVRCSSKGVVAFGQILITFLNAFDNPAASWKLERLEGEAGPWKKDVQDVCAAQTRL